MGLTLHPAYNFFVTSSFTHPTGQGNISNYMHTVDTSVALVFIMLFGPSRIEGLFIR